MIDWGRVSDLRSEIGAEDFAEVVTLFLEETDEVIDRLPDQTTAGDVERNLHFLKGSALNLGFRALAMLCGQGERSAAGGDVMSIDLHAIIACYHESITAFRADLAA